MSRPLNSNKNTRLKSTRTKYGYSDLESTKQLSETSGLQPSLPTFNSNPNTQNGYETLEGKVSREISLLTSKSLNENDNVGYDSKKSPILKPHIKDTRGNPNQSGKKFDTLDSKTMTSHQKQHSQNSHKTKLFTQPFVPQFHRQYASPTGRQQQFYNASDISYHTSPVLSIVGHSPGSTYTYPHNVSYASSSHHGHYQHHHITKSTSPGSVQPHLSPTLSAPSAPIPIPIPQNWTNPNVPHYYAVPSPGFESQQLQYQQYYTQYQTSPQHPSVYASLPNQSLSPHQPHPYRQRASPTSPSIHHNTTSPLYNHRSQQPHQTPPLITPRGSKAIPIINPNTMTPVHADTKSVYIDASSNNSTNEMMEDKSQNRQKEPILPVTSNPLQFIDPAIKEQEEREQQELEEQQKSDDHQEISNQVKQHDSEPNETADDKINSCIIIDGEKTKNDPLENNSEKMTEETRSISLPSEINSDCISTTKEVSCQESETKSQPESQHAIPRPFEGQTQSIAPSENSLEIPDDGKLDMAIQESTIIQYDPAFLMQFMPLCLESNEDLSFFRNASDNGNNGNMERHNRNNNDKRQNDTMDRHLFQLNGNNNHSGYSNSAPGGNGTFHGDISLTQQHRSRDRMETMGKFIGGRTLTTRNSTIGSNLNNTNHNNNQNNMNINVSGNDLSMQRESSFNGGGNGRTRSSGYTSGHSSSLSSLGRNGGNHNKHRHPHHELPGAPTIPYDQVAPLEKSANRWVPSTITTAIAEAAGGTTTTSDQGLLSQDEITRKVKALLNKLTLERFDSISDKIIGYAKQSINEDDGQSLRTVIQLIFEKACDEAPFAAMWAQLCRKLYEWVPPEIKDVNIKDKNGKPICGNPLYCKYLLNRCQQEFEKGWKSTSITTTTATDENGDDDSSTNKKGATLGDIMMTEEYYKAVKIKRQGLGLVQFIGELYRREMLSQRIMYQCLKQLCDDGAQAQEEEVESLCKLLTTIGADIDRGSQTATWIDVFFKRMKNEMYNSPHLSSRVKFMILDVFDLRKNNWIPRKGKQDGPKTIAEIHEEAENAKLLEKEAMNKRLAATRGQTATTSSYNTSRQGSYWNGSKHTKKNDMTLSGMTSVSATNTATTVTNDRWSTVSTFNKSSTSNGRNEVSDYSNFGRAERGRSRNNVLGPSYSPFASLNRSTGGLRTTRPLDKKKSTNSDNDGSNTTSISTTNNMFSALSNEHYEDHSTERKKLTLLPKGSKSHIPSFMNANVESGKSKAVAVETSDKKANLDITQLKRRIKNTLDEYYELNDLKELFASTKELDHTEKTMVLATQLLDVIEKKEKQVEAAENLIPQLYKARLLDKETMVKAFQIFLNGYEDLVIDVPQAPIYVARLLVHADISLSEAYPRDDDDDNVNQGPPSSLQQSYIVISQQR
ncbi:uncharacterized protein BX664DRAFT_329231 [Halteromyces radiatus]|uniref:uncharacterized protein n=1 Tax=Halteromyces radiatus TaxID=101107 RepID=UPI00221F327B|nr:uncharacterized protein BX664DRAFT_329231 [Halteromyces radiatus]KAI8093227.1 hypothetical protein BX664DRAFT_329231 [Halteromyces radiatus]